MSASIDELPLVPELLLPAEDGLLLEPLEPLEPLVDGLLEELLDGLEDEPELPLVEDLLSIEDEPEDPLEPEEPLVDGLDEDEEPPEPDVEEPLADGLVALPEEPPEPLVMPDEELPLVEGEAAVDPARLFWSSLELVLPLPAANAIVATPIMSVAARLVSVIFRMRTTPIGWMSCRCPEDGAPPINGDPRASSRRDRGEISGTSISPLARDPGGAELSRRRSRG